MKTKIFALVLSALFVFSAFALSSCDESEPLPEGVSALPDLNASELAGSLADESGVIQWPADLLPDGFPVPDYDEIHSVSREDNELRIVLLARKKINGERPDISFEQKLYKNGFVFYLPAGPTSYSIMPAVDRDGWRVQVEYSNSMNVLAPLAEKYGFAYEINVRQGEKVPESLFWKYPAPEADLGYESKTLYEWPAELLPDNVPVPDPERIVSMESRANGIFITVDEPLDGGETFEQRLYGAGYCQMGLQPHRDENGNYFYMAYDPGFSGADRPSSVTVTFQICKYNDKIIK